MSEHSVLHAADGAAALAAATTFLGYMPDIAAFMAVTWYCIRFVTWVRQKIKDR